MTYRDDDTFTALFVNGVMSVGIAKYADGYMSMGCFDEDGRSHGTCAVVESYGSMRVSRTFDHGVFVAETAGCVFFFLEIYMHVY
jgi:hypothetical protein